MTCKPGFRIRLQQAHQVARSKHCSRELLSFAGIRRFVKCFRQPEELRHRFRRVEVILERANQCFRNIRFGPHLVANINAANGPV